MSVMGVGNNQMAGVAQLALAKKYQE